MKSFTPARLRYAKLPVVSAKLRIAQLSNTVCFEGAQAFPAERWSSLKGFAPNVLVGAASELQRLVQRIDLQTVELPSLDHAVFVITEVGDKPLTDVLRVVFWQRFGVPVYELYMAPGGTLVASECEAQEGWHVEPEARFAMQHGELVLQAGQDGTLRTGLKRYLEPRACACGRTGLQILAPEDLWRSQASAPKLAAIA